MIERPLGCSADLDNLVKPGRRISVPPEQEDGCVRDGLPMLGYGRHGVSVTVSKKARDYIDRSTSGGQSGRESHERDGPCCSASPTGLKRASPASRWTTAR